MPDLSKLSASGCSPPRPGFLVRSPEPDLHVHSVAVEFIRLFTLCEDGTAQFDTVLLEPVTSTSDDWYPRSAVVMGEGEEEVRAVENGAVFRFIWRLQWSMAGWRWSS